MMADEDAIISNITTGDELWIFGPEAYRHIYALGAEVEKMTVRTHDPRETWVRLMDRDVMDDAKRDE